jgi:hypothetical protein
MEGDMGQRVDQMEQRLLQAMGNLMAGQQAGQVPTAANNLAADRGQANVVYPEDPFRNLDDDGPANNPLGGEDMSRHANRANLNQGANANDEQTTNQRPRSRGNRERDRGKRYNVGPRFSDSEDTEDLAQYAGMPWHQAGVRGRTKVRNAELFQMAQQAQTEQADFERS